ncbi:nucleoside triphosphate hydrolase [Aureimonas sp. SA4125]|uniref:nucleoside triphosphate hydrolase n=1 Tax=Aureimonas sp. SA4125 TaxID=2826993 RepID=UPI001CC71302|nr:nucleoside triphosphate hydrolase [Aureimonas sp. SA4125]BDA86395.1 nucleoside triphosphate hydrolase [Aureimonas sp. SA4125]
MTRTLSADTLIARLLADAGKGSRLLVALAGPPGAGKSTTTATLADRLNAATPGLCGVLAMDGYHFDDAVLHSRGHRPRKGAPFTFDLGGLRAMLQRLKADDGTDIAVPLFDRKIEIARAGAAIIPGTARIVLVEGNYLLLDEPGWCDLKPLFDVTVMLVADPAVLEARLTERWMGFGLEGEDMRQKMEGNDLPNLRLVLDHSLPADFCLRTDAG